MIGLYTGEVNGLFDSATSEAVAKFQGAYGCEMDGIPTVIVQEAIVYEATRIIEACGESISADIRTETIQTAKVSSAESIRLREKPDAGSNEVAKYRNGTVFTLLERGDIWSKLRNGSSVGYIKNKYLEFGAITVSNIKFQGDRGSIVIGYQDKSFQLNREKPCKDFKEYYEKRCSYRATQVSDAISTINKTQYTAARTTMIVSTGSDAELNLRSKPDAEAEVIGRLPNGTRVIVTAQKNGWSKVEIDGISGFVVNQYLSNTSDDYSYMLNDEPISASIITEEGFAYIYSAPNKNSKLKTYDTATQQAYVLTGTFVTMYSSKNGFTYISYKDRAGKICFGFVLSEVLSVQKQ